MRLQFPLPRSSHLLSVCISYVFQSAVFCWGSTGSPPIQEWDGATSPHHPILTVHWEAAPSLLVMGQMNKIILPRRDLL